MNELLTAYLYFLYTARGGRLSAGDALRQVMDLASSGQRAMSGVDNVLRIATGFVPKPPAGDGKRRA